MKHSKRGHGKRVKANKNKKRNLIIASLAIFLIAISVLFYIFKVVNTDMTDPTDFEYDDDQASVTPSPVESPTVDPYEASIEYVDVSDMPSSANGFKVIGQIVIDKIGIKCYIYDVYSDDELYSALEYGTIRFYRTRGK